MSNEIEILEQRISILEATQKKFSKRIQELEDIENIRQLKHRYLRSLDIADVDLLADQLAEDFTCRYQGADYEFNADSRTEFVEMIATFFNDKIASLHQAHHPEIEIISDSEATGIWYLEDIVYDVSSQELMAGTVIYRDRYEKINNRWQIKYSEYTRVVEIHEKLTNSPNFLARYLAKHGRKS